MLLQRRPPRHPVPAIAALITASAVVLVPVLLADAWFQVCTSATGRPLAFALADMSIEVGMAAACMLLARAVWKDARDRN